MARTFADSECVIHLEAVRALADVRAWPVDAVHQRSGALVRTLLALIHVCKHTPPTVILDI